MLSAPDNDILCRVGPGTAMGSLMRQYWVPALMTSELPAPDCPPLRLRLLGENLIAFRATSGKVGIVANSCPHRGASLFFGRNEEEGLRCVYHGWKFDVDGNCVDMPSEPAESNFKSKVKAVAYPCEERNGVIWTYMGPRETVPGLPHFEANMNPPAGYSLRVSKTMRECNYMQALEGDIDTVHSEFLHFGATSQADTVEGSGFFYRRSNVQLKFVVAETDFGVTYAAYRPAGDDSTYWRVANFLFPFFTQTPTGVLGWQRTFRAWVPLDDENVMFWSMSAQPERTGNAPRGSGNSGSLRKQAGQQGAYVEHTSDWLGRWRLVTNKANDYLLDREEQRTISFSGLPGVSTEDKAVTESMGPIYQRSSEHLGTTDSMIIRTRRRLIQAAKTFKETGITPPGVDNPELFAQRTGWTILPNGMDWLEGTKELRKAFVDRKLEDLVPEAELAVARTE
jgi:phenylpropionate dioxygenase-like ring-hydroxylating dioxygenase large terminal subunit